MSLQTIVRETIISCWRFPYNAIASYNHSVFTKFLYKRKYGNWFNIDGFNICRRIMFVVKWNNLLINSITYTLSICLSRLKYIF